MSEKILSHTELVRAIATQTKLSNDQVDAVIKELQSVMTQQMKAKGEVRLPGFGTFKTLERSARTGRNPKTGEPLEIGAKTVVAFVAGKSLKESIQ